VQTLRRKHSIRETALGKTGRRGQEPSEPEQTVLLTQNQALLLQVDL
jgi:hypothetical protein